MLKKLKAEQNAVLALRTIMISSLVTRQKFIRELKSSALFKMSRMHKIEDLLHKEIASIITEVSYTSIIITNKSISRGSTICRYSGRISKKVSAHPSKPCFHDLCYMYSLSRNTQFCINRRHDHVHYIRCVIYFKQVNHTFFESKCSPIINLFINFFVETVFVLKNKVHNK